MQVRNSIAETEIDKGKEYVFSSNCVKRYRTSGNDIKMVQSHMLSDLDRLYDQSRRHATIDTYARKLYLTRKTPELRRLKNLLCCYFIWLQLNGKPDQRYDTFLADILHMDLKMPNEISIISWNYDSQFEIAYRNYTRASTLPIFEKQNENGWESIPKGGLIVKLNGSATFGDYSAVIEGIDDKSIADKNIWLIECYDGLMADTSSFGFQLTSHLSFAWENADKVENIVQVAKDTVKDAVSVVVIGYSFPFFNRQIDREVFNSIKNLHTVYIQAPDPLEIKPALEAVLPMEHDFVQIVPIRDCSQFYLPREL